MNASASSVGAKWDELIFGRTPARWADRVARGVWAPDAAGAVCPRCAGAAGPGEVTESGCGACRDQRLAWDAAIRLGPYRDELRDAIHDAKYRGLRGVGLELGRAIGQQLRTRLASAGLEGPVGLVPVPGSWWRRVSRHRGIDHTRTLARGVREAGDYRIIECIGRRRGRAQTGLSATERARNAKLLYQLRRGAKEQLAGFRVVVLIDDVRTTGATLTACAKRLRSAAPKGAAIWTAVAGVPAPRDRRDSIGADGLETREKAGKSEKFGGPEGRLA